LLNRRGFRSRIFERSKNITPLSSSIALFMLDLDGFKDINDAFGHAAGDACLRQVARRLKIAVRGHCDLARMGGDEFSIVRHDDNSTWDDESFSYALMEAVRKPITWRGHTFEMSTSIGYTRRLASDPFELDDVVRESDLALYEAKAAGRNCSRKYSVFQEQRAVERALSLQDARVALQEGRFELYYQPKIRLVDESIVGFECLLRMHAVDGDIRTPGSFQAALDDAALSKEIGEFVINSALDQASAWHQKKIDFGSLAINLSASQFRDAKFASNFIRALDVRGVPHTVIEVEVTEGVFLSATDESVLSACRALSDAGIRIAFDDFGTGFASLSHLRDFPVDVLKIDRSFIKDLSKGGNATAIVNAMVGLGINLSMDIVAEGVESEVEAAFLKAIGCHFAQGFLYSKALPADIATQAIAGNLKTKKESHFSCRRLT
jgi:diguanylate cyclase (GGDEF)-like protein